MTDFDAIVVGASVAGATTAARLGKSGYRVLLLEKAAFPRAKVCGEGLMPGAVNTLDRLGLRASLQHAGAQPFSGIRFFSPKGKSFELDFTRISDTIRGLILPRTQLDCLLADYARKQPGVVLHEACTVAAGRIRREAVEVEGQRFGQRCRYTARLLIAADGIPSRFHPLSQIRRRRPRFHRFALRTYYPFLRDCQPVVEVHFSSIGEAYVAPLGGNKALVALLLFTPVPFQRARLPDLYFKSLTHFPQLRKRLSEPYPPQAVEATAPVASRLSRCHGHRFLMVGDAAGAVDPVTGQGMSLALKDAELVCRILEPQLRADRLSEAQLASYTECRNRYFLPSYQLAEFLLLAFRRSFLVHQAIRSLSRNHRLSQKILQMVTDLHPTHSLGWKDRLQLVLGL